MEEVQVTPDEFYQLCNQLYPEQSVRVMAEIRAAKYRYLYEQAVNGQGEEHDNSEEVAAVREGASATGADSSSGDS